MKHMWLCLDPGITTGWALLADDGEVKGTSVWGTDELGSTLDLLIRANHLAGYSLTVVQELMPSTGKMGALGQKLERVRQQIALVVEETYELPVVRVAPGEWKPSRIAKTTRVPGRFNGAPLMVHQKDAIKMGRYVIDRESRRTHHA